MEASNDPDYRFYQTYLYAACGFPGAAGEPWGTMEIKIHGHKGQLICRTRECLGRVYTPHPLIKFPVTLETKGGGEKLHVGYLAIDSSDTGLCSWDFSIAGQGNEDTGIKPATYKIVISAEQDGAHPGGSGGIVMGGIMTLPFELRDNRVVGFKKEATVRKAGQVAGEKNPFFQRVEPFQPPIPYSVWWQISIQPDFRYFRQANYCPRQKPYKAVF